MHIGLYESAGIFTGSRLRRFAWALVKHLPDNYAPLALSLMGLKIRYIRCLGVYRWPRLIVWLYGRKFRYGNACLPFTQKGTGIRYAEIGAFCHTTFADHLFSNGEFVVCLHE